ncbi:MAG: helix-hairpin-helix domain-containing protein [Cyclobacteriaceae bacterium]|nr:helix-hairpin-helix domain-containing protein [Cyclobacteriaceae bacterium]
MLQLFRFSHSEAKGTMILLFLSALILLAPRAVYMMSNSNDLNSLALEIIFFDDKIEPTKDAVNREKAIVNPHPSQKLSTQEDSSIRRQKEKQYFRDEIEAFELNSAEKWQLMQIKGIGEGYANRILEERERLCGFASTDQIYDVWGISEELASSLAEITFVDLSKITGIMINDWDEQELAVHPYINYRAARLIYNYRMQHGPYQSADELLEIKIFTKEFVNDLRPYLRF